MLVGLVVALGLTGCAAGEGAANPANGAQAADLADLSLESEALAEIGFATDLAAARVAAPTAGASARPGKHAEERRLKRLRGNLGKRTLHAEATVQTRDGVVQTLVVQRGEITAVDGDSVTVKSTDGFSLTWTFGERLRIVQRGAPGGQAERSALEAGVTVGLAGARDGADPVARLIVIPQEKAPK
jgi:hypothetical protein